MLRHACKKYFRPEWLPPAATTSLIAASFSRRGWRVYFVMFDVSYPTDLLVSAELGASSLRWLKGVLLTGRIAPYLQIPSKCLLHSVGSRQYTPNSYGPGSEDAPHSGPMKASPAKSHPNISQARSCLSFNLQKGSSIS